MSDIKNTKRVEEYDFGRIVIDGKEYSKDVIIFPNRVESPWWRKKGHNLSMDDLETVIKYSPDELIIGKGANGIMKVPDKVVKKCEELGMKVTAKKTGKAVELLNENYEKADESGKKVVGAFHLTC